HRPATSSFRKNAICFARSLADRSRAVCLQHARPAAVVACAALAPLGREVLPAAVFEDDDRAVLVARERDLDLGRVVTAVASGMPREAHAARDFVVENLAPHVLAAVLRPLDQAPAVAVLEAHRLGVLEIDPVLAERPPVGDLLREDTECSLRRYLDEDLLADRLCCGHRHFFLPCSRSAAALKPASASSQNPSRYSRSSARPSGSTR